MRGLEKRKAWDTVALIIWTNDYRVGVESLDDDHILIFSLVNHIDDAHLMGTDEKTIGEILKVLIDQTMAHFQREEMLMKKKEFPDLDTHTNEHRNIIKELQSFYDTYQDNPSAAISGEIVKMLSAWLEEHVLKTDMRYGPYLSES